jgi:hypothetical protein
MGNHYEEITPEISDWIRKQHLFFVATAPLSAEGHVNCSPKGLDTFRVLNSREVAYLDVIGSGAETIAHVRENGRILFMFCAFSGGAKIIRLHGQGKVILPGAETWSELIDLFPPQPGTRSIIVAKISRVSDSCGFGVPKYEYVSDRQGLAKWAQSKGPEGLMKYRAEKNAQSIDGLPGLDTEQ